MIDLVSVTQALLVAEHLSFSRAAQVLGVRQSAVGRRVRALEDKLGVSLFERDSTGVQLTEAGRRFLERTWPALSEIDHAMKAAASAGRGAEGVIRIGTVTHICGQHRLIKPWLQTDTPPPPDRERPQSFAERAQIDGYWECILCFCCTSACPELVVER